MAGLVGEAVGTGTTGVGEHDVHRLVTHQREVDHLVVLRYQVHGAGTGVSDGQPGVVEGTDRVNLLFEPDYAPTVNDLGHLLLEHRLRPTGRYEDKDHEDGTESGSFHAHTIEVVLEGRRLVGPGRKEGKK